MAVPAQDRRIAHRYRLKTACGRSGLGRIWHAQDTPLGRQVEVREVVFPPGLAEAECRIALASAMRELGPSPGLAIPGGHRVRRPGRPEVYEYERTDVEAIIETAEVACEWDRDPISVLSGS